MMSSSDKTVVQALSQSEALPAGTIIAGRYRLERVLGQGGMGVVYLAMHQALKKPVALKLLQPHLAARPEFVARFHREAEAIARLRHRHIVGVSDFGDDQGRYYLVFDYIDGGTLESHCLDWTDKGGLPVDEAARLLGEVLEGLAHAHRAGIIHRDLKPANILLEKSGEAKISDFGLARVVGDEAHRALIAQTMTSVTASGGYAGTIDFMAPELKAMQPADARSDLYAVGVTAYWMLTGRRPGAMAAMVSRAARGRRVPAAWDAVIVRALAEEPADRFQTAEEMLAAIHQARSGAAASGWRHRAVAVGLGVVALLAAAAAGVWWSARPDATTPRPPGPMAPAAVPALARTYRLAGIPAGAQWSVGGAAYAPVPAEPDVRVAAGAAPVEVSVRVPGMATWHARVGEPQQPPVVPVTLVPLKPRPVRMVGLPAGAVVRVGGVERTADAEGRATFDLLPGTVQVHATARHFEPVAAGLSLEEGQAELKVVLKRIPPPAEVPVTLAPGLVLRTRRIEPGEFTAGSPVAERGRQPSDEPEAKATVAAPFYLGVYEFTQAEYVALMHGNPSASRSLRDGRLPVEQVSWTMVVGPEGVLDRLNALLRRQGLAYRADLPTEREWEYACRAGTQTALNDGHALEDVSVDPALDRLAVYRRSGRAPERVGSRQPNAWGLHDMHGNVAEWTRDQPVLRGGSWQVAAAYCRSASRVILSRDARPDDTMGFRIVLRPTDE
jgi:formylglycine-generating enzyme required for sulfatase activity